jgi:hypothetical protein
MNRIPPTADIQADMSPEVRSPSDISTTTWLNRIAIGADIRILITANEM